MKLKERKFYHHKSPIFQNDADIQKLLVSSKISFGKKNSEYFIGCLYNDYKVKPLHIILPKTSAYVISNVGRTKWMYCYVEDDDLLEQYNSIWDKDFASELFCNKKFFENQKKSHSDEVTVL